jgi:hypothetical protein
MIHIQVLVEHVEAKVGKSLKVVSVRKKRNRAHKVPDFS